MAQELSLLDIDEVSLVDAPANSSVDPATGRKVPRARVALWKRDEGGNQKSTKSCRSCGFSCVELVSKTQRCAFCWATF